MQVHTLSWHVHVGIKNFNGLEIVEWSKGQVMVSILRGIELFLGSKKKDFLAYIRELFL